MLQVILIIGSGGGGDEEGKRVQNPEETKQQKSSTQISLPVVVTNHTIPLRTLHRVLVHQGRQGMKFAGRLKQKNKPGQAPHRQRNALCRTGKRTEMAGGEKLLCRAGEAGFPAAELALINLIGNVPTYPEVQSGSAEKIRRLNH